MPPSSSPVAADKLLYYVIWQRICLFLDDISLLRLGGTATILREIVNTDDIWTIRYNNKIDYGTSQNYASHTTLSFFEFLMSVDLPDQHSQTRASFAPLVTSFKSPIVTFKNNKHFAALLAETAVDIRSGNKFLLLITTGTATPWTFSFVKQFFHSASSFTSVSSLTDVVSAQNEIAEKYFSFDEDEEKRRTLTLSAKDTFTIAPNVASSRLRLKLLFYILQKRAGTAMMIEHARGTLVAPARNFRGVIPYWIGFGILKLFTNFVFPSFSVFAFYNQVCEVSGYPGGGHISSSSLTSNTTTNNIAVSEDTKFTMSSFELLSSYWPLSSRDYFIFDRQNPLPYIVVTILFNAGLTGWRTHRRTLSAHQVYSSSVRLFRAGLQIVGDITTSLVSQLDFFWRCQLYSAFVAAPALKIYHSVTGESSPSLDIHQVCHFGFWITALFPYFRFMFMSRRYILTMPVMLLSVPSAAVSMFLGNIAVYCMLRDVKDVPNHYDAGFAMNPVLLFLGMSVARALIRPILSVISGVN